MIEVLVILWWFIGFMFFRHVFLINKPVNSKLGPVEIFYSCIFGLIGPIAPIVFLVLLFSEWEEDENDT